MFGLKRGRSIAWHNNTACHAAGSLTSAVQPYIEQYANLAQDLGRVVVDLYEATHDMPKPGYFQMLGGPASGPEALVATIQHWGWKRIVVYFQNDPDAVKIADTFASLALPKGIEFELQLRESPGKDKGDVLQLLAARSNIYIFFGGVRSLIMRLHFVVACSAAQLRLTWLGLAWLAQAMAVSMKSRRRSSEIEQKSPSYVAVRLSLFGFAALPPTQQC